MAKQKRSQKWSTLIAKEEKKTDQRVPGWGLSLTELKNIIRKSYKRSKGNLNDPYLQGTYKSYRHYGGKMTLSKILKK